MKIVADENMPLVQELFGGFGEVVTAPGRSIGPALVADADVLLVRSVTPVDEDLLSKSRVKFVGTATIGTDHLDVHWLSSQGIAWASAPGCNAAAVGDYVIAALCAVMPEWLQRRVAIVGCGNVGRGLYRRLSAIGLDVRCVDPFLDDSRGLPLVEFEEALDADILCLHTPLTRTGPHPTWHLFDADTLARLKPGTVLLNAGRGEVIDNQALLEVIDKGRIRAVLDVWEGEPHIDAHLLGKVALGTPHIAGYSLEGRLRGSLMVHEAFRQWLGRGEPVAMETLLALMPDVVGSREKLDGVCGASVKELVLAAYDPRVDCQTLRAALANAPSARVGVPFDDLRKHYPWRREFSHFSLPDTLPSAVRDTLVALGFRADIS